MSDYQVIIVGGGPVGLALGIELGMQGVKTVIYEKHRSSLISPRAQLLNPRSMEFFRRWGISEKLISKKLLSPDFPMKSVWCSSLAGEVFGSVDLGEHFNKDLSPENYQRIPLWITEEVLRERLRDFSCVELKQGYEVVSIAQNESAEVTVRNRSTEEYVMVSAEYIVGCDGANSNVLKQAGIKLEEKSPARQMTNVLFTSQDLKQKMTVPKSILYYNLTFNVPMAVGCVDYDNGLWYAQIFSPTEKILEEKVISDLLDQFAGFEFEKNIKSAGKWVAQSLLATEYRNKRIFLAGDAAHSFPPTGGHGLNTGLGDAVNLGWKLAAALHGQAGDNLLESYTEERRPIAIRNMQATMQNLNDAIEIRKLYPPEMDPRAFAKENERIAKQHTLSFGVALGYCYSNSSIIIHRENNYAEDDFQNYKPSAQPGYVAPHLMVKDNRSLYDDFSANYILLTKDNNLEVKNQFLKLGINLQVLMLEHQSLYPNKYYLLRPDWHIAWTANAIPSNLTELLALLRGEYD